MVPDAKSVLEFYHSEIGPFSKKDNALLIDSSTIGPINALNIHQIAKSNGHVFVDAPVSGGVIGAERGTLTFMVGAEDDQTFQLTKDILKFMGSNIKNCEKAGMG